MKIINDFCSLTKIYFSNSKVFIISKNEMDIIMNNEKLKEEEELYKSFIDIFLNIFNTNYGFSVFSTSNEFLEKIIYLSIKTYIDGFNLGLFDNIDNKECKKELILISQFIDVIEKYIKERKVKKGIIFKLLKHFRDCYNKKDLKSTEITETLSFLFAEIKDKLKEKEKIINLFIELLIKERKFIDDDQELVKYILNNGEFNFYYLYKDLIPFLNEIFKNDIDSKLKLEEKNDFTNFNSGLFNKINDKCKDSKDFEEMLLYFFETKIIYFLNNNYNKEDDNEKNLYTNENEIMIKNLRACLEYLENDFKKHLGNKTNKNISLLFCIAFIKCFLYKFMKYLYLNKLTIGDVRPLFNIIKGNNINAFRTSIKLYVLKLLFDNHDNYYNYFKEDPNTYYQIDYNENKDIINLMNDIKIESLSNDYGFDYLIIPSKNMEEFKLIMDLLLEIKRYNINNEVDDRRLIQAINDNYDIDIFYCALLNIHFSYFCKELDDEGKILNKWLIQKINNKEFSLLNHYEMIKNVLLFLINKSNREINNNILTYEKLLCLLLSARFVFSTISFKNDNGLYYQLITNAKNTIINKKNSDYFKYYFKDFFSDNENEERFINYLTYKIMKYIILSHLYFGNILGTISLDDIKNILSLELKQENNNNDYILDLLFNEFEFIKNQILKLIGIKSIIIFMNSIFEDVSSKIINIKCNNEESDIKTDEFDIDTIINDTISNYKQCVEEYENNDIVKEKNKSLSNYHKVLFEINDFYNNKSKDPNKICPYISYLTSTNFCTFDDFKAQFLYTNNEIYNYPLIYSILKNDDIIELINCIPYINNFINNVYNELALKISVDDINKKLKDVLSDKTLDNIDNFNEHFEKILEILNKKDIKKITRESTISEVINVKNNNINNIYDELIKRYNKFLSSMKLYNRNKDRIDSIIIQNGSGNDYITFIKIININNIILVEDRLNEIIQIYSKRNRILNNNFINIYDGGKIIYDYELIEDKLEKEFILGKKIFEEKQKLFIFSNEVFNEERKNILLEVSQKYPQVGINEEEMEKIEEYLNNLNKEDLIRIYYNLQYIIININNTNYDNNEKRLDYIVKFIEKSNYLMNDSFKHLLKKHDDIILLNNIIFFYEKIELKVFEYLTENMNNIINVKEISKENIDKIEEILNNKDSPINKDIFIDGIKKYILRYCLGNNNNKNDILNNFKNLNDIFNRNDVWGEKIFNDQKFKKFCSKLKEINNKEDFVLNYCLNILFEKKDNNLINEEKEEENEEDLEKINRYKRQNAMPGMNYMNNMNNIIQNNDDKEEEENEDEDVAINRMQRINNQPIYYMNNNINKKQNLEDDEQNSEEED